MKKLKARRRRSAGAAVPKSVDEYIAAVAEPARSTLNHLRAIIRSEVPPEATEVLSYGIPAFKHKQVLVWYAAFANHYSLFPTAAIIERFKDELDGYSISKGTIKFPLNQPLPAGLVRKIVRARVAAQRESKKRIANKKTRKPR